MKLKLDKERIKQIVLTLIAFFLIMIGYLNYNFDQRKLETVEVASETDSNKSSIRNETNLGDVQLVNSEPEGSIVPNENIQENIIDTEIVDNSKYEYNYFEESRIERNKMYSEMLETYQNLLESVETPADQKAIAIQQISNITKIKNGIMIAENLIKNKGFEDVVIMENNGMVSVVVKSIALDKEQISKIQNIIERELNVEIQNINISNR